MDSRFALLCVAVALLAGQVYSFPSSDDSKEEVGKAPSSTTVESDTSVTSKRSPDQLDEQKVAIKLPATATKLDVHFPEDSKQAMSPAEGGENARSKKSPLAEDTYHSPHTTTVCIQVRSDHRPEVVCGPQVGEQKDDKAVQTPAMARYAYPSPQMAYSSAQGYYDSNRQRPIYGPPANLQPNMYGSPSPKPFIMRSPQEQPQYLSPTPMRASGPVPQQFPAQAQGPPQQKFVQDMPSQMGPKSPPAAGRGPGTPVYFRTTDDETNSIKPAAGRGPGTPVYFRTTDDETNSIKPNEEKYQPAPVHATAQIHPNMIIQKVMPVPVSNYYTYPLAMPPSYRFNCALQPDGLHNVYGVPNVLRSSQGGGQAYYQSTPATWGNQLDPLFSRAAESQKPYGDAPYYYDLQGRQAQSADQILGSSTPYATGYSYGDSSSSLYGDEASAYAMAGRSASSSDVQRQWEQDQYFRMAGASAGGMSFEELSARAVQQQNELYQSKMKLQQMQQQLKDIEHRAASAVPDDKDKDMKKDPLKDPVAVIPTENAAQKSEVKPGPVKKRRSNNA